MSEQWLPVLDWENLYEISDSAKVRSLPRVVTMLSRWGEPMERRWPGRLLAQRFNHGYLGVDLWDGARRKKGARVHVLMLEAFVGPRPAGMWGLHRDDNRLHNSLGNLYWGTPSQNHHDCVRNGTHHQARKACCTKCGGEYSERTGGRRGRFCRNCVRRSAREWARRTNGYYERHAV